MVPEDGTLEEGEVGEVLQRSSSRGQGVVEEGQPLVNQEEHQGVVQQVVPASWERFLERFSVDIETVVVLAALSDAALNLSSEEL